MASNDRDLVPNGRARRSRSPDPSLRHMGKTKSRLLLWQLILFALYIIPTVIAAAVTVQLALLNDDLVDSVALSLLVTAFNLI